jgi:phosphatidylglycerol:prolipoprotein diacylglycerol transferase
MYPTISVPFLGVSISTHALMILLAAFLCYTIGGAWIARKLEVQAMRIRHVLLIMAAGAIVGGRLNFFLNLWTSPSGTDLTRMGFHAPGAVLGLAVALPFAVRHARVSPGAFADVVSPVILVGIALSRIGCFLRGCCFGSICAVAWCVRFPPGSHAYRYHEVRDLLAPGASSSLPVYPLQLFFAAAALMIGALSLWLGCRKLRDGKLALIAVVLWAGSSAALEFTRAEAFPRAYWGPLPQLAWLHAMIGLAAVALLRWRDRIAR